MPQLFSYGTLQDRDVQIATFGRPLTGRADSLLQFTLERVGSHANAVFTGRSEDRVRGTLFDVNDDDLSRSDEYEGPDDYARTEVVLASGARAWMYAHTPSSRCP